MSEMSLTAPALWRHPEFRRGSRDMIGISLGIGAWGLVTGVATTKSAIGLPLALFMTLLTFSGSAQLASLPLIASGAPVWVVWATAMCVNLRFVIFSAMWRPYFGRLPRAKRMALAYFMADLNYVTFMRRFPEPKPGPDQVPYFLGGAVTNWLSWMLPSITGVVLGAAVPTQWGIGFAGTLALLGLIYSMLTDRVTWVAAAVAGCAAVAAFALPFKLNILVAIAAAVAVGLMIDHVKPMKATA